MRRLLAVLSLFFLLNSAVAADAQEFTLNAVTNCGPNESNGIQFNLAAGTHNIEWLSGAYSFWSSNGQNGGLTWIGVARVYVHATTELFSIGDPVIGTFRATQALAEAPALGVDPITLTTASLVTFYLSDGGGCGDNRGSVTLRILAPVPVEQTTWGAIKALYQ